MRWIDACTNSVVVTTQYDDVPELDPFHLIEWDLYPTMDELCLLGYLPRLPDRIDIPDGQTADRATLFLSFSEISNIRLSGKPIDASGRFDLVQERNGIVKFDYVGESLSFNGTCRKAVIGGLGIETKFDPGQTPPRDRRLFSHPNVFNSCLLLLQEYGYSLTATGPPNRDPTAPGALNWHAEADDGTRLSSHSPIELLGLAQLHRHQVPASDESYWWRVDGPSVIRDLIRDWERKNYP